MKVSKYNKKLNTLYSINSMIAGLKEEIEALELSSLSPRSVSIGFKLKSMIASRKIFLRDLTADAEKLRKQLC